MFFIHFLPFLLFESFDSPMGRFEYFALDLLHQALSFNPSNVAHVNFRPSVQILAFTQQTRPFQNLQVVVRSSLFTNQLLHYLSESTRLYPSTSVHHMGVLRTFLRLLVGIMFCHVEGAFSGSTSADFGLLVLVLGDLHGGSWSMT